jgi:hypothetical protein
MEEKYHNMLYKMCGSGYCYADVLGGWTKIIIDMYTNLKVFLEHGVTINSIKSTQGVLSVSFLYSDNLSYEDRQEVNDIIGDAEKKARCTCEICGIEINNVSIRVINNQRFNKKVFNLCDFCDDKVRYDDYYR